MVCIVNPWVDAEIRFLQPTDKFEAGDIVTCKTCSGAMVTIERDDGGKTFFRKDRFELVAKKRRIINRGTSKGNSRFAEKQAYNQLTKMDAIHDAEKWPDEQLREIYTAEVDLNTKVFPHPEVDDFCKRFGWTYCAVEEQVRFAESYRKTRKIRDFYYREGNKQVLKSNGEQMKNIMDSLLLCNDTTKTQSI